MADWANGVPSQLMSLIFEQLSLADGIRCGAVCTNWRDNVKEEKRRAPEIPWLLMLPRSIRDEGEGVCRFYNVQEQRVYKLDLPQNLQLFQWCRCIGSSDGWLVLVDDTAELHMVNPFTGSEIRLPSVATLPDMVPVYNSAGGLTHYWVSASRQIDIHEFVETFYSFHKAAVSWTSTSSPSGVPHRYTVALIYSYESKLALAREGDTSWTTLTTPPEVEYCDVMFFMGQLYALTWYGHVHRVDTDCAPPYQLVVQALTVTDLCTSSKNRLEMSMRYLAQSAAGELLQVVRWTKPTGSADLLETTLLAPNHRTTRCKVFKLRGRDDDDDEVDSSPKWVPERSLDGQALFLGFQAAMSTPAAGHSSSSRAPQEANRIYFADQNWYEWICGSTSLQEICVYSMEDGSSKPCYPRSLQRSWQRPNWIIPNLDR